MSIATGLSMRERFHSDALDIRSVSVECCHGKHYHVEVVNRACGHTRIVHSTSNYRAHWAAMYDASERLILGSDFGGRP
jgi:formate dehydrogenase assembly factor FdhD